MQPTNMQPTTINTQQQNERINIVDEVTQLADALAIAREKEIALMAIKVIETPVGKKSARITLQGFSYPEPEMIAAILGATSTTLVEDGKETE